DPSYVATALQNNSSEETVSDDVTEEHYLVTFTPLYDSNHNPIAIIVAGKSLSSIYSLLQAYTLYSAAFVFVFMIPLTFFTLFALRRELKTLFTLQQRSS